MYKYIRWLRFQDQVGLYDLERDPHEKRNLAYETEVAGIRAGLDSELKRLLVGAMGLD